MIFAKLLWSHMWPLMNSINGHCRWVRRSDTALRLAYFHRDRAAHGPRRGTPGAPRASSTRARPPHAVPVARHGVDHRNPIAAAIGKVWFWGEMMADNVRDS